MRSVVVCLAADRGGLAGRVGRGGDLFGGNVDASGKFAINIPVPVNTPSVSVTLLGASTGAPFGPAALTNEATVDIN